MPLAALPHLDDDDDLADDRTRVGAAIPAAAAGAGAGAAGARARRADAAPARREADEPAPRERGEEKKKGGLFATVAWLASRGRRPRLRDLLGRAAAHFNREACALPCRSQSGVCWCHASFHLPPRST